MTNTTATVGTPAPRIDAVDKVTGRAKYAYEYRLPDATYAWPIGATIARGRVVAVDDAQALAQPGVVAVLSAQNAGKLEPGVNGDLFLLQDDTVAFRGQIVAAVIATSLETARHAAGLVHVQYEHQPHDVELRADDEDAYVPAITNDLTPGNVERGDADQGFRDAQVQVDVRYTTPAEHPHPMEPHTTTAVWDDSRLTLYHSDQGPYMTAQAVAAMFGMAVEDVEIVAQYVGGGFGSKAAPRPPLMLAALAAKLVGRPVKVALNRPQMTTLGTYRTPTIQRIRLGADRDGRISAIVHEATQQSSQITEYVEQTVSGTRLLYDAPNVRTTARVRRLNVATPSWFRAPGHSPGVFALECAIDELAHQVGRDPVELRIVNEPLVDPETGEAFSSRNLVACLREGAARFDWDQRDPTPAARREGRWLVGSGVAAASYPAYTFPSTAMACGRPDGTFVVRIGAADIGTGARTVLTQIAATTLGVPLPRVQLDIGRASHGAAPFAGGSMGTASWGWAVDKACRAVLEAIDRLEGPIPTSGVEVTVDTTDDIAAREQLSRNGYGAQFAQVSVDIDTGQIRVDRMLGVFATGQVINPRTARSQVVGAMTMGLSMALLEASEPDLEFGDFANHDLAAYHVAAHADVVDVDAMFLPEQDPHLSPIAAKGIGEIGIVGAAAAVANALHHATGLRLRDLPIRVEDVRTILPDLRARR